MNCKLSNKRKSTPSTIKELLKDRGIEDIDKFYNAGWDDIQSPFDLENIEKGAELLSKALQSDLPILIVQDSDCDGLCSAVIIGQYIKEISPITNIVYRIHEGKQHGLEDQIDWIEEQGADSFSLVICPDSATNDFEYAERLKALNTPLLVLDHHILDRKISDNAVIVNNQISPKYCNKELTGAGVTWQFCRAFDTYRRKPEYYGTANKYIDLAAIGNIGDMCSVLEIENRAIFNVAFSKPKLDNYFMWTLAKKQSFPIAGDSKASDEALMAALNPISVAFYIVPLLNAMIRVGTNEEKKRLLEAVLHGEEMIQSRKKGAEGTLDTRANEAIRECTNAREHQNKMLDEVQPKIEAKIFKYDLLENQILFIRLDDDDILPKEINGLLAMRLSAKYRHPTIVARLNENGYVRGSLRGVNNSKLTSFKKFLEETELFEYVQGHDNSAGLSLLNSRLSKLHEIANERLKTYELAEPFFSIDFEFDGEDERLYDLIFEAEGLKGIWGQRNDMPLIHTKEMRIKYDDLKILGKNNDTIKWEYGGVAYIMFRAKDKIEEIQEEAINNEGKDIVLEVIGEPSMNYWRGNSEPQIKVKHLDFWFASKPVSVDWGF